MKIKWIELAGFRGVREKLRLDVPREFLVVSGANGAGKSTIFDAFEFLLTGQIAKYGERKERNESVADYVWWRGAKPADDRYVKVCFVDGEDEFEFSRGPSGDLVSQCELESLLCHGSDAPEQPLVTLASSSLIRDELIASASLDLSERARFDLVQSAVGALKYRRLEEHADEVCKQVRKALKDQERRCDELRREVRTLTETLSEEKVRAGDATTGATAVSRLRSQFEIDVDEDGDRVIETAIKRLHFEEGSFHGVTELRAKAESELEAREKAPDFELQIQECDQKLSEVVARLSTTREQRVQLEGRLNLLRRSSDRATLKAQLGVIGSKLGLETGRCPLCNSRVEQEAFNRTLEDLESASKSNAEELDDLLAKLEEMKDEESRLDGAKLDLEGRLNILRAERERAGDRLEILVKEAEKIGVDKGRDLVSLALALKDKADSLGDRLARLRSLVLDARSYTALAGFDHLERKVVEARSRLERQEQERALSQRALDRLNDARRSLARMAGDIVDERLAAMSPVLKEFYRRLRPHPEWLGVDFSMRGDVQRYLSLLVGQELNPSFMFSSGQRRAMGLSFLLSVVVTRSWSPLQSILLDDPIQHVDDFRALHLAEVLSAIRAAGFQVIVSVEDPALAALLCRRLSAGSAAGGLHVEMEYRVGSGARIARESRVHTPPTMVLLSA